jgi:hypothetical protein
MRTISFGKESASQDRTIALLGPCSASLLDTPFSPRRLRPGEAVRRTAPQLHAQRPLRTHSQPQLSQVSRNQRRHTYLARSARRPRSLLRCLWRVSCGQPEKITHIASRRHHSAIEYCPNCGQTARRSVLWSSQACRGVKMFEVRVRRDRITCPSLRAMSTNRNDKAGHREHLTWY